MTIISSVNIPMCGLEIIIIKDFPEMADTANNLSKAHKSVTLKAHKKAHSEDARSARSVVFCFIAVCCFSLTVRAELTNDVDIIRQELQELRYIMTQQTMAFYSWTSGEPELTEGTQLSLVNTLFNIAVGLHDSIFPCLQRIDNNTSNLVDIVDIIQKINDTSTSIESKLVSIGEYVNYIYEYQSSIFDRVYSIDNYISYIYQEFLSFKSSFENFKDLSLTYLQSIDNNVGVIAQLQTQNARYIEDIYNSLSAGINVNLANGFPEPIDYTALLERISNNNIWGQYNDWFLQVPVKSIVGRMRYITTDDLSTNMSYYSGQSLTGNFFTDVANILVNSDSTLSDIDKSLKILVSNIKSNNVQDIDLDAEATDGIPTDTMDNPSDITAGLSFQSTSGYLTLPDIKGLEGKQFPNFISFEVPPLMGNSGGIINIPLNKYSTVIETARNLLLFFYWGVTVTLFITLYCLFSNYVLSNLLKLAFAFVQKGKAV